MKIIKPCNKEIERLFRRLSRYPTFDTKDMLFTRSIGKKYPDLINNGFLKIKRNDEKHESVIYLPEGIGIAPIEGFNSRPSKFLKFGFFRRF